MPLRHWKTPASINHTTHVPVMASSPAFAGPLPLNTCLQSTRPLPSFKSPSRILAEKQLLPRNRRVRYQSRGTMVFTGIVEEMGAVSSIENLDSADGGVNLTVNATVTLDGVQLGDSISVNGTCLTVAELSGNSFKFGLAPETLRRTNLGALRSGSKVNLERSLSANGRFGGHVVQGHVDCSGEIVRIIPEKDAIWFTIRVRSEFMKYIVEKGYIAIDGTSLTVCDVSDTESTFTFMMIPFTQAHVVTALKSPGDDVNIEVDITGKYIERIMAAKSAIKK